MALDLTSWTTTERQLASIWSEVLLGLEDFSVDEVFLDLGGDSISATLCVNRIANVFGVEVPTSMLLDGETTVRALAAAIDQGVWPSPE